MFPYEFVKQTKRFCVSKSKFCIHLLFTLVYQSMTYKTANSG